MTEIVLTRDQALLIDDYFTADAISYKDDVGTSILYPNPLDPSFDRLMNTIPLDLIYNAQGPITISLGKPGDETIEFHFNSTQAGYTMTKLTSDAMTNPIDVCNVDDNRNKIEPACEGGGMETVKPLDETKVRILMVALSPSEIAPSHQSILTTDKSKIEELRKILGLEK